MMQRVTIRAAKAQLSRLIEAALDGGEIVIAEGNKPVVRLVPVQRGPFQVGLPAGHSTPTWARILASDPRLSHPALTAINEADTVLIGPIAFFEIAQEVRLGTWPEMASFAHRLPILLKD